ncbi:MAG: N-acetylmuramoyl-L-alanine amidase [Candidatus Sericytochromatia bacterium]|nr:N-acetylmuramoyl-L-alanine amidase [Candidatus Sericytochromatia bacterium]
MFKWCVPAIMIGLGLVQVAQAPAQNGNQNSNQSGNPNYPSCGIQVKTDRARSLSEWKPAMSQYSLRHYGEQTWELQPAAIVMHYTAGETFPWNLVNSKDFAGEKPGLASHYVVDGNQIWELLPPSVRSRATYGINHRAISIEMVARDAADLAKRKSTLQTATELVRCLMRHYQLDQSKLYSHQAVARMNPQEVPEVKDLIDDKPYHKIDPGEANMHTIRQGLRQKP